MVGSDIAPVPPKHLWAHVLGPAQCQLAQVLHDRYWSITSFLWRDTKPQLPPLVDGEHLPWVRPYQQLLSYRLHVPRIHDLLLLEDRSALVLLDNVPLDDRGQLAPSLEEIWPHSAAILQLYLLLQWLELWEPLQTQGVAESLLHLSNLRIDGWCVRLLQLVGPELPFNSPKKEPDRLWETVSLAGLGQLWEKLLASAHGEIAFELKDWIALLLTQPQETEHLQARINHKLLELVAKRPLRHQIQGATDVGVGGDHNEDSYFPSSEEIQTQSHGLAHHFWAVCDGIEGHEGGEVASQLAIQSLKMQVETFLEEVRQAPQVITPPKVAEQLETVVRIANNILFARNEAQHRQGRHRMATTMVLGLQLPQSLAIPDRVATNSHEIYITHVGDSRAYWLTATGCHLLTLDDDLAAREAKKGRSIYRQARQRPDANALTQALGTKDGDRLTLLTQRLVVVDDGVLLLCTDGLSDREVVDRYWPTLAGEVFNGQISLKDMVDRWIALAREQNEDNVALVAAGFSITPDSPFWNKMAEEETPMVLPPLALAEESWQEEMEEGDLELDPVADVLPPVTLRRSPPWGIWGLLLGMAIAGGLWWGTDGGRQSLKRLLQQPPWQVQPTTPEDSPSMPK